MNVADLLHDSPSDDLRRRHARQEHPQEQHPHPQPPPQPSQRPPHHSPRLERPRDQLRERERPPQDLPHPSHPHPQQPLAYRRSPPPLHPSRPSSPPRHPPAYGGPSAPSGDFPAHSSSSSQRHFLPSPSAILSEPPYEVVGGLGPRRVQELPHDRLGPPPAGHPSSSVQIQPFVVEHRTPSIPPKSHLSHPNHHAHSHPSTPSPMYMAPPPGRSIHASPPHTQHSSHGPGQGSIPLFPTPVGPGVPPSGPPMHAPAGPPPSSTGGMSLRIGDPPPMYGSHGPSPHPHSQPYSHHSHHRDDRHRGRGSSTSSNAPPVPAGVLSSTASPVMASLQRPAPYDERDRDRERELREMGRAVLERDRERAERMERERVERDGGPGMVPRPRGHPGAPGPGLAAGPGSSLASMPSTPISPGPGRPLGHFFPSRSTAIPPDRRERDRDRGMEREERERRSSVSVAAVSPLESPEVARRERDLREKERELRERELREREIMEKEKARQERQAAMKDRERQERHAQRERELQAREREQMQLQQMERERERERELRDQEMRERMRQREMLEREQREREREQAERDGYRRHMHEIMGVSGGGLGLGAGPSMVEAEEREREREWVKQQKRIQQQQQQQQQQGLGHPDMRPSSQGQPPLPPPHEHQHRPPSGSGRMGPPASQGAPQVWSRILPPQMGPTHEDERMMMEREQAERRRLDEMPPREVSWDAREAKAEREPRQSGRGGKGRTTAKEKEERAKAAVAEGGERAEPQRRQRVSAREKEQRERERRAEMEQQEREQHREQHEREQRELERREREREREQREFRMREHEFAWRQEAELMEQERMQRAMHEDALRAGRAREVQGATHGQQPLHHHPHSAAGTPFGPEVPQAHPKLLSGKSGPMGTPSLAQDLPPQYQHERERDFRHPPKGGPAQIQMGIPPHSQHHPHLPGPHPHQIGGPPQFRQHQDMYGPGPISRRPSPPPFHPQSAPAHPAATMLRRSGSPPAPLVLAIKHLGTFVYPRTPFPFLDFPPSLTESGAPADPLDIRATIFLPSRFLPLTRPARPRIWGGALIPAVPPLSGTQRQMCIQFSGAHPQYGRPWPEEVREGRRVYTDDSDLFLCALHAGWVSWSQARKARRESRDLRIEVKLTREARFVGGFGNVLKRERGEPVEDLGAEDDGRELLSSGWGNGHDGAGVEILRAEFVLPGTAHSFGLRNRSQRMLEYAERRAALGCGSRSSRKRRRLLNGSFADGESTVQLAVDQEDEELCDTRVMVFGTDSSWPEIGFKYHPDALSAILFPQASSEGRPSKRRKLAVIADNATSATPPLDESSDDELVRQQRAVVVETLWESFLISQRGQIPSSELENDKENASDAAPSGSGRRYVIALLTNAGGTMGRLSKSTQQQSKDVETADATQHPSKPVPAADKPAEASGMVNGLAQPGSGADASPQEKGASAGAASDSVDLASDADAKTTSTSKGCESPAEPPESIARAPSSSDESTDEGSGPIQILHRDLGEENFEFVPDGINVVSGEVVNGMRKGWKLEARQWKWVQVGVSS